MTLSGQTIFLLVLYKNLICRVLSKFQIYRQQNQVTERATRNPFNPDIPCKSSTSNSSMPPSLPSS
jgi:hypothetical protein